MVRMTLGVKVKSRDTVVVAAVEVVECELRRMKRRSILGILVALLDLPCYLLLEYSLLLLSVVDNI